MPSSSSSWVRGEFVVRESSPAWPPDPADELVTGKWGDVIPCMKRRGIGDQRVADTWKFMYDAAGTRGPLTMSRGES